MCVWDECQNVAPPDEWNKRVGGDGIELRPISSLEPCLSISTTGSARKYYPTYRQTDNIYQTARDRSGGRGRGTDADRFNHRIPRIPVSLPLVDQIDAAASE